MSAKWMTSHGVDGATIVRNNLAVDEILCAYERPQLHITSEISPSFSLPQWFVKESFHECEFFVNFLARLSNRGISLGPAAHTYVRLFFSL